MFFFQGIGEVHRGNEGGRGDRSKDVSMPSRDFRRMKYGVPKFDGLDRSSAVHALVLRILCDK